MKKPQYTSTIGQLKANADSKHAEAKQATKEVRRFMKEHPYYSDNSRRKEDAMRIIAYAFIGLAVDHLIRTWADQKKIALGMT